jgi:hypothetical protein
MKINHKQIRCSLQLLLHLQKNKVTNSQDGYAMLITSIIAILMFSMLSVYLFSANLYKSVANSVVDSGSTFYAAETGMNKRASAMKATFEGYSQPTGESPAGGTDIATQMGNCINSNRNAAGTIVDDNAATIGTGDFRCREIELDYKESAWKANGDNRYTEDYSSNPAVKYRAYSFVRKITPDGEPNFSKIPAGEEYAGLNMQEYKYRVYTTAMKRGARESTRTNDFSVSAQTLLQMDFNSRLIPLFQFAAFYEQSMEINSASDITLSGPVHSNTNVYLATGGTLRANSISAARRPDGTGGGIFKSSSFYTSLGGTATGFQFILGSNTPILTRSGSINNCSGTPCATLNTIGTRVTATEVSNSNNLLNPNAPYLRTPSAGFLNRAGTYYSKADLRVTFDPTNTNENRKFVVESIQRPTATTVTNDIFADEVVRSLRQPVMLVTQSHDTEPAKTSNLNTAEWSRFCAIGNKANFTSSSVLNNFNPSSLSSLNLTQATAASDALRRAIARSSTIYKFTDLNTKTMNSTELSSLKTLFKTELDAIASTASLSAANITTLISSVTPREIANKSGNCFLPAPMQVLTGQRDRQENRNMTILQSNIHSLTIWNRDGLYLNAVTDAINSSDGKAFARATPVAAPTAPIGSYEWMGLALSDRTQRGLVWHSSVNPATTYTAGQSPYGFAFSGGRWLPGPLTLATDQIAYIQGDYNNPGGVQPTLTAGAFSDVFSGTTGVENFKEKKPAAVLADAIGILSNNCVGTTGELNCFNLASPTVLPTATTTTVHAAFLAGTSSLNSGLNNYIRMMENWGGTTGTPIFRYRGSLVSLGAPQQLNGAYISGGDNPASFYYNIPRRDFGFDTTLNSASGLPPMSPQAVYLKQKVFRRDYNSNRSN